jgi:hypothetical protein
MQPVLETLERYGFIILLIVIKTGVLDLIFNPIENIIYRLLEL